MSNTSLFVKQIIATIKGDEAEATAIKIQRQATNALTPQIAVKEAMVYDLEEAINTAKEKLSNVTINFGKPIEDREQYIRDLFKAKEAVIDAEEALEDHEAEIEFLKEILESVKK